MNQNTSTDYDVFQNLPYILAVSFYSFSLNKMSLIRLLDLLCSSCRRMLSYIAGPLEQEEKKLENERFETEKKWENEILYREKKLENER